MRIKSLRRDKEKGANLVEFALVAPFLILLLFGIVEFAWVFATNLDVKHGAREGARITAVDQPAGNAALGLEICSRMDIAGVDPTDITWTAIDTDGNGLIEVGDGVQVTVSTNQIDTLTGILDFFFAGLTSLDSTVEIRIEQTPTWSNGTETCP